MLSSERNKNTTSNVHDISQTQIGRDARLRVSVNIVKPALLLFCLSIPVPRNLAFNDTRGEAVESEPLASRNDHLDSGLRRDVGVYVQAYSHRLSVLQRLEGQGVRFLHRALDEPDSLADEHQDQMQMTSTSERQSNRQ